MRRHLIMFSFALVVLLGLAATLFRHLALGSLPRGSDLSITLVGFTNVPVSSRAIQTSSNSAAGLGLGAIFAITNTSSKGFIRFETAGVEWRRNGKWEEFGPILEGWPTNLWGGISGYAWPPGNRSFETVAWPGIPTNLCWRLRVSIASEPGPFQHWVNMKLGREVFGPRHKSMILGPEVSLSGAFKLLSGNGSELANNTPAGRRTEFSAWSTLFPRPIFSRTK